LRIDRRVNIIDRMVKNLSKPSMNVRRIAVIVRIYVAVVAATLVALGVLSAVDPGQATQEAWIHAAIVAVFAVVLPLRLRSAATGSVRGLRAVGLISAALLLVNAVEASISGLFPVWMRVEMVGIALLMACVILLVVRERVRPAAAPDAPVQG
jgi:hypothetical protein